MGQSLRSEVQTGQSHAPEQHTGESERTDIMKTQDAVECQTHHADVGTRGGRIRIKIHYEDCEDLGTEVDVR